MTTNNILSSISYCSNNTLCQIGNTCINNKCEHNSMLDFSINNSVGFIFVIISTAFCTVCSLSGTAINLSIIIFLLNFYPHEAKILSHYTYIMPYVVNFITISTQMKNPFRNIKAVDYNITLIVSPMFIIGFIIGDVIIINEKRIYLLIGLCLCALVLWVYFIKYAYIFYYSQMKPSKEIHIDKTHHHINDNNNNNIITEESEEERRELPTHKSANFINETLLAENNVYQDEQVKYIITLFLLTLLCLTIINIDSLQNHMFIYVMLICIMGLILFTYSYIINNKINVLYLLKLNSNYPYTEKDIKYNNKFIRQLAIIGLVSGVISGFLGTDPLLLVVLFLLVNGMDITVLYASAPLLGIVCCLFCVLHSLYQHKLNLIMYDMVMVMLGLVGGLIGNIFVKKNMIGNKFNEYFQGDLLIFMNCLICLIVFPICYCIYII